MAPTSLEFRVRVGVRFHPTKEELVNHYLMKKIQGHDDDFKDVIREIDICSCEPWDLPESDDDEWFYFSRPNYKPKGKNRNRATKKGFWKITGREKVIKARRSKAVIGKKRTLTFYKGRVRSGQKTNWVMHEYYIPKTLLPNTATQRDFVLCHLKKKDESTDSGAGDEVEPRTNDASDIGNPLALVHGVGGPEENTQSEENLGSLFPSQASTESPQSYVSFSSFPRGNCLLTNASEANHLDTEEETEFVNSILDVPDDYVFEERTDATLNHSTVGETHLERGVAKCASFRSDMLSRPLVTDQSSQNESGRRKGDMVASGGAEMKSGPADYITLEKLMAQSYRGQVRQGFKRQDVEVRNLKLQFKEERTHATLNHSTVGDRELLVGVAQGKHYIGDQDIELQQGQAHSIPVASSLFKGDKDVVILNQPLGEHAFSANKEASGHQNIDHLRSVSEETKYQKSPSVPVEKNDSNMVSSAPEESSLNESSCVRHISLLTRVHCEKAPGSMPSTTFATEESSSDESSNSDFVAESTSGDLPQAIGAGPSTTFATEESCLDESSHFDLISQSTSEQLPQPAGAGPSLPLKNLHYVLQGGAETHNGSKGWFNVCKTSLVIHRSYLPTVYLLMILITSTFLLYTLARGNGRESVSLKPLLTFVKNVVIPVSVAVYCRERKHGILFSLLFSFGSYFLAHQICVQIG